MKISELMDIAELERHIAEGLVSKRKHPMHPIYILNYTAATQFAWNWNDVTLNCRGLVIDEDYNIVARSLPKFFSYEQLDGKLPEGNFIVEEKLDGSMLLAFNYNGNPVVATRGSFESEQAIKGAEFLGNWSPAVSETWIFEIIYNDNRIVVDYDFEGLVLLGIQWLGLQREASVKEANDWAKHYNFRRPKVFSFNTLDEILAHNEPNCEGFVLRYDSGERVKIKTEDYKRLHRLITGVSEKTVWEALKDGKFSELIENVPDEFYDWVRNVETDLLSKHVAIEMIANRDFERIKDSENRREFAIAAQRSPYSAVLFKMLDGQDYSDIIWKLVKPEVTKVFKMVNEASN